MKVKTKKEEEGKLTVLFSYIIKGGHMDVFNSILLFWLNIYDDPLFRDFFFLVNTFPKWGRACHSMHQYFLEKHICFNLNQILQLYKIRLPDENLAGLFSYYKVIVMHKDTWKLLKKDYPKNVTLETFLNDPTINKPLPLQKQQQQLDLWKDSPLRLAKTKDQRRRLIHSKYFNFKFKVIVINFPHNIDPDPFNFARFMDTYCSKRLLTKIMNPTCAVIIWLPVLQMENMVELLTVEWGIDMEFITKFLTWHKTMTSDNPLNPYVGIVKHFNIIKKNKNGNRVYLPAYFKVNPDRDGERRIYDMTENSYLFKWTGNIMEYIYEGVRRKKNVRKKKLPHRASRLNIYEGPPERHEGQKPSYFYETVEYIFPRIGRNEPICELFSIREPIDPSSKINHSRWIRI